MRYDHWDAILFPRDSLVPIQEFRTACYVSQDEHGRQLQTLTCYITSLPPFTPFRISIHSWMSPLKPSAVIESRRKIGQRVIYKVQVIIDGARVYHGFYETGSKWPQEIMTEKRSTSTPQSQSMRQSNFLEFPPFHQNILLQNSWDAREPTGRVKVLLSEQLVRKTSGISELDLGAANDIVCFSFQHAPRDILEQAGISWPIRNPLYLPSALGGTVATGLVSSRGSVPYSKSQDFATENDIHSPLARQRPSSFPKPRNPEPFARPRTNPPQFIQHNKASARGRHVEDSGTNAYDDMSVGNWSMKQPSHGAADMGMLDLQCMTPGFGHAGYPWRTDTQHDFEQAQHPAMGQARQENNRQVMVTLRDDQLGQIIDAISPSKPSEQRLPYPKMAGMSIPARPSAASLARKASYQELSTKNKAPYLNENTRPPTSFPHADRVPTPHPFVVQPQATWDSDVSMRDASMFSNMTRQQPQAAAEPNAAQIPAADASVRSKKEGMQPPSSLPSNHDTRHDQSLLPEVDDDQQFMPGHKGMSSMDSTSRLERQLFSALGEELNNFDDTTEPESFETSTTKRKRRGTFEAERDRSPIAKMVREEAKNMSDVVEVPHLRGGE